MSYVKIWVHCVWGTKKRIPFITDENKSVILDHIKENAKSKNIFLYNLNGDKQHLHGLISLKADQTLSNVMQLIKGESSFWINKNKITQKKFEWADEYFAVSVSDSQVINVKRYIDNQEKHHKNKSWEKEYDEFINIYGFQRIKG